MSRPLIVSAPGKAILHGEHAVVYGKEALATSLDLRCYLILLRTQDGRVKLHLPEFVVDSDLKTEWCIADLVAATTEAECGHEKLLQTLRSLSGIEGSETPSILSMTKLVFLYLLISIFEENIKDLSGLAATVISNLPAGSGLGSSAAYSVCLAAGFLACCDHVEAPRAGNKSAGFETESPDARLEQICARAKAADVECGIGAETFHLKEQELELVNRWSLEAEKLIHGTPSGIDNSVSTYGGAISFKSGRISRLQAIPRIRILVINTNVPRSTKKMVAGVRERYDRFPSVVSPILESIENVTKSSQLLLRELRDVQSTEQEEDRSGVHSKLQELFCVNQHLLNAIGVGHPSIDKVCTLATSLGLSAKLTGGGGGGCVIALLPTETSDAKLLEFKSGFQDAGFECWETNMACDGVTFHSVAAT